MHWEREVLQRLAMASLDEQKKQRWWRVFFRFAWLFLVVAVLLLSYYKGGVSSSVSNVHTAVVQIKGEIASDSEASADSVIAALRSAFEEDSAKAVVLLINSPGGSPVQAGIINDEVKRLKALHQKPVYAVIEEMGASAAYYIAVSADTIYVDKASIVGSICVLMDGFGFNGLMDKLGIERRLLTAGENKGFWTPLLRRANPKKPLHSPCWSKFTNNSLPWSVKAEANDCTRHQRFFRVFFGVVRKPLHWAWPMSLVAWTMLRAKWSKPKMWWTTRIETMWLNDWPSVSGLKWARVLSKHCCNKTTS